jgi:hypothetical protein
MKGSQRWLVLAGIVYVVLGLLGTVVYGDPPDFVDEPAKIAAFYGEESGAVLAGDTVYLLSGFFLLFFVAALRAEEQGSIDPQAAAALWDISSVMFGLAAPMAWAVAVLSTAAVALRSSALPSWLGALSVVMGIALLIPPINFISILVMGLWIVVVAIVFYLRAGTDGGPQPVAPGVQPADRVATPDRVATR